MTRTLWLRLRASWVGRHIALALVIAAFACALITYASITASPEPLSVKPKRIFTYLLPNIVLLLLLIGIIGARIVSLWSTLRANAAGSKLQNRIIVLFSLVTILPTLCVSVFSAFLFNFGIETWFNQRVQTAVNQSLAVAEAYLAEHKENIRADALAMAGDLNRVADVALSDPVEYNRIVVTQSALRALTESIVFQGNHILAEGRLSFALAFERLPPDALERAAHGDVVILNTEDDKVRALVKLEAPEDTYLLVGRLIDSKVIGHMEGAQGAVKEYQLLKHQLDWWQVIFSIMFATISLWLLLAAIRYGMMFASRLTTPIASLVAASERVRGGDFSARVPAEDQKDEIGTLARAFNRMTEQLEAQRGELIDANRRLDERRRFSEAVLSGVSAGVLALNSEKSITLYNPSAAAILSKINQPIAGQAAITELLPGIGELLAQAEQLPGGVAQDTLTLSHHGKTLTLHARVTAERQAERVEGFIVTFDDITPLVAAQRNAAWADVARRVAHEIKNPLTPIQLAAERLKRKYLKFITEDADTFTRYTDTIVRHVGDIGRMVEEFVSFARMPAPSFQTEDVAAIIRKAVFSAQVAHPNVDYRVDAPDEPAWFTCDERQISQVLTNLLKNAAEAIDARLSAQPDGRTGCIGVTLCCDAQSLTLAIEDNGIGLPNNNKEIQQLLDPYVTTRAKGTGLGLAIVKKIVEDHKGTITLLPISTHGARVVLSFAQHCDINSANSGIGD